MIETSDEPLRADAVALQNREVKFHAEPGALRGEQPHETRSLAQARDQLGDAAQAAGLWLPTAGWVSPADYCRALLAHDNVSLIQGELHRLEHNGWNWCLFDANGDTLARAPTVVLANGWQLTHFTQTETLPSRPVTSQLIHIPRSDWPDGPPTPVVGGGTLCPTASGWQISAGHWHDTTDTAPEPARNAEIIQRCGALWRLPPIDLRNAEMRGAVRATGSDYLPSVGGAPDFADAADLYDDLSHGRPMHHYPDAPYHQGLYLIANLGGRGITCASYCAELLANTVYGDEHPWQAELHPLRFMVRELKRGKKE